jgi:hypothetical protein
LNAPVNRTQGRGDIPERAGQAKSGVDASNPPE